MAQLKINTPRLTLRRFTKADIPDILEFTAHPSVERVVKEFGGNEEQARKHIETQRTLTFEDINKCIDLGIELKDRGGIIGIVSFVPRPHQVAEIGWALHVDYRGRGYATEAARALADYAFSTLKIHRLHAITRSANTGSWKVMERLGMKREGQLREHETQDGERVDVLYYGILRSEWEDAGAGEE